MSSNPTPISMKPWNSQVLLLLCCTGFITGNIGPALGQTSALQPSDHRHIEAQEILTRANSLLEQNRSDEALIILEEFSEKFPGTSLTHESLFLQAIALKSQGQVKHAIILLEQLLEEHPTSRFGDKARLTLGNLYTQIQEPQRAIAVLKNALNLSSDPNTHREARHILRLAYEQKGDFAQAIQIALHEINLASDEDRPDLLTYVQGLILQKMDEQALSILVDKFPQAFPGDLGLIRLIELHTSQSDEVLAERDIRAFLHHFPNHPYAQTAVALLQSFISRIKAHDFVIAAVFPFSGKAKPYGTDALNGVRLALRQATARQGAQKIGLVVKDSSLPMAQLEHEFTQVLREFHPIALIGPLLAREVQAVAGLPDFSEVPFITPTASIPDIRRFGRYWFSTTLTIPLQVRNLVDYAMQRLGHTRFSILAPDTSYGREIGKEFHRYVQENGGYIIASQLYTKGTTDASMQILRIKDRDLALFGEMTPLENEKGEEHLIYSPGFDAVFLPGHPTDVAFLSAQLAFYDVKVSLLGSNSWNSPELLKWGKSTTDGSIFGDGLFLESTDPKVQAFIEQYRAAYRNDPSIFAAQAYDATRIVLNTIDEGATTGTEIRDQLFIRHDLPALGGLTAFDTTGILDRKVYIIQVTNGQFEQIN